MNTLIPALQIIQQRNDAVMKKYNVPSIIPSRGINLEKIKIGPFCKQCLTLLLDPNILYSSNGEQILLPAMKRDYQTLTLLLLQRAEIIATTKLIGERLRYFRKLCGLTGTKVASLWAEYGSGETTQATISNHEKARFNDIKLSDILTYVNIYNSVIPLELPENTPVSPGQITIDDILFGCSFSSLLESVSIIETKENSSQSLPPSAEPLFIDSNPTETVVSDEMTYPRWVLRILLSKLSDGKCECCGNPAPFRGKDMAPYLMLHHIDKSKGDTLTNCVVLCPNCNMKLAHLQDEQMDNELQEKASQHSVSVLFEPYQF